MKIPAWLTASAWSLLDQLTFAVANFVLSILLARTLSIVEYGVFSLVFSIYILVTTVHTGLISEPMLVFGASRFSQNLGAYFRYLLRLHWLVSGGVSGLLALAATAVCAFHQQKLAFALLGLAIALPMILLLILLRRSAYLNGQQRFSGMVGVIYLLLILGVGLLPARFVSSWSPFVFMGLASAICVPLLARQVLVSKVGAYLEWDEVWRQHLRYGQWSLPANLLSWVPWNFPYVALAAFSSLENTAYLRSYMNLVLPMLQLIAAVNTAIVPIFSRRRDRPDFQIFVIKLALLSAIPNVVYWLIIGLGHAWWVGWVYSGRFVEFSYLLWILAFLPTLESQIVVLNSSLRALEHSRLVFVVYLIGSISIVFLSLSFLKIGGLTGLAWSMLGGFLLMYVCLIWLIYKKKIHYDNPQGQ